MNKKLGFLVEGDMEQKFVQKVCTGAPVQKINCNGDDVSMDAIAKRVGSLARLLQRRCNPIVVVFDRERREATCEELRSEFLDRLSSEGVEAQIVVGIPDRDIENWVLADYSTLAQTARLEGELIPPSYEGRKGKTELKKLLGGRPYVETVDGVAWLRAARPEVIAENSPSFNLLKQELNRIECWWLDQGNLRSRPAR